MHPDDVILAFLAARFPAAYSAAAVTTRVKRSGLIDQPFETLPILSRLAKLGLAELEVDELTGEGGWSATAKGRTRWMLSGQLLVN